MKNLFWAIVINVAILIVFLVFTDLQYSTNDDRTLALAIGQRGYFFFPFTNYFLNVLVAFIQKITPFWNAWVGCQIVFSFAAFTAITYVYCKNNQDSLWIRSLGVSIVLIFAYDHYAVFQFSQTAALLMVAGSLLIIQSFQKTNWPTMIAGGVMLCIGTWYRYSGIYAVLCFSAIYIVYLIIQNRKRFRTLKNKDKGKLIHIVALAALLFAIILTNQVSKKIDTSTPELKLYTEYNSVRAHFTDYPRPTYNDNKRFFQELGISKNDYSLMQVWFLDANTTASLENLKRIIQLQKQMEQEEFGLSSPMKKFLSDEKKGVVNLGKRGINTIFLIMLAIIIVVVARVKYWPLYIVFMGAYIALYLYLYTLGRIPYRATYVIDLAAIIWCAYSIRTNSFKSVFLRAFSEKTRRRVSMTVSLVMIAATCLILNIGGFLQIGQAAETPSAKEIGAMYQYINDHPEKSFILSTRASGLNREGNPSYHYPLKPLTTSNENSFSFGGWTMMSPYRNESLARKGLSNVFGDIVDNESVYVVEFADERIQMMEQFFTDHYAPPGKTIYFEHVEDIGEFPLWQVKTSQ